MNRFSQLLGVAALLSLPAFGPLQAASWDGSSGDDTLIFSGAGEALANGLPLTGVEQADAGAGAADLVRFDAAQTSTSLLSYRNFEDFVVDLSVATPLLTAPEVVVSGQLSLQNFSGAYAPGDFFQIIDADQIGGSFSGYDLPDVSDQGLAWFTNDLPTEGNLRLVSSGPPVAITERSQPAGLIQRDLSQAIGSVYRVNTPPFISNNQRFAFWTFNGIRQQNPNGRAQFWPSTIVTEPIEAVAHYLEVGADGDGDRMEDWWEFWVFGNRDSAPNENTDGDVFDNITEFNRSLDPLSVDLPRSGGVSLRLSPTVAYTETGAYHYRLISEPYGLIGGAGRVVAGDAYTSPSITSERSGYAFVGFWVDGQRQADAAGVSLTQFSMTPGADFEVEARFVLPGRDEDADGIADAHEYRYYGDLDQEQSSDFDGDGITDRLEYARNFSPNTTDTVRSGGVSLRASPTTIYAVGRSRFTRDSIPIGLIAARDEYVEDGTAEVLPLQRPNSPSGFDFAYWQVNGLRLSDAAGVSLREAAISITENTEALAVFIPSGRDQDGDGLADWHEYFMLGSLESGPDDDPDSDGISLADEFARDFPASLRDTVRSGGVSLRASPTLFYPGNLLAYETKSEPFGLLPASVGYAQPGTRITSDAVRFQNVYSGYRFVHWTLNGVRQSDLSGTSVEQAVFPLDSDSELVAHFIRDGADADGDTLPDAIELRYAAELDTIGPESDLDGDGISVGAEIDHGLSPVLVDWIRSGGLALRPSALRFVDFTITLDGYYAWIQDILPTAALEAGADIHLLDDYDGDGVQNLLEYAMGLDLRLPDREQFMVQTLKIRQQASASIQLEYGLASPAPERVVFEIQSSTDMQQWRKVRRSEFQIDQELTDGILWESLGHSIPEGAEKRFYRLRIRYE